MNSNYLFVRQDRTLRKVSVEEIAVLEVWENYTRILMIDDTVIMARCTLAKAFKKLQPDKFVQVHRSHVVAIRYIDKIYFDHIEIGEAVIPVGRNFYAALVKRLTVLE